MHVYCYLRYKMSIFLSSCFEFFFFQIHSHKWNSRKVDGVKLEHTYFKTDCSLNDYIPVNVFLSTCLPGCSVRMATRRLGWQSGGWEIRVFFHFSCAENECKKLKLDFIKSKSKTKEIHFGQNNNKYLLLIMFIVNSRVIDSTLLIYKEDKEIEGWFVKSGCGWHVFPRSATLERLPQDVWGTDLI